MHRNDDHVEGGHSTDVSPNSRTAADHAASTDNHDYQWRARLKHFIFETKITDWLLAFLTLGLVLYTAQLVRVASKQTRILSTTDIALKNSARAATDANKLNETALRPWVDFDLIEPSNGFAVTGDKVTVGIKYSLKNTGRLPAIRTNVSLEMLPLAYYGPVLDLSPKPIVTARQLSVCKKSEFETGNTIFPGQPMPNPYIVTVGTSKSAFDDITTKGKEIIAVLIAACVGYQLAINGNYGHTGVSLIVARGTNSGVLPLNLPAEGTIKLEETIKMRLPLEIAD